MKYAIEIFSQWRIIFTNRIFLTFPVRIPGFFVMVSNIYDSLLLVFISAPQITEQFFHAVIPLGPCCHLHSSM